MGRSRWNVAVTFVTIAVFLPLLSLFLIFPPGGNVSRYLRIVIVGIAQASVSASLALLGGLSISYFLARRRVPGYLRSVIHALSKVSFVFPGVSMALGFLLIFGKNGVLNHILKPFGLRLDLLYSFPALIMGHAFYNIPVVVYITGTLWENLSGSVVESAEIDGASKFKVLRSVEIPILLPSIVSSYLMAFIYSFTSFAVVMTIGGFRYRTLEVEIYSQISNLNFERASLLTILQLLIVSSLATLASVLRPSDFPYGTPKREKKGRVSSTLAWVSLAGIVLPMTASLIYGLVSKDSFRLLMSRGWEFLGTGFPNVLMWSFLIASTSASLSTLVSFFSGKSARFEKLSGIFATVPSAVSSAVLAFSYLSILLRTSLENLSPVALAVLHATISLPMAHRIMESGWRAIPFEVEEAARVDGAGILKTLYLVDIPLLIPSILRTFTLSMAISMSELAGVLILAGDKFMTMSSAVYRLMSSRHLPEATALNSVLVLITILLFLTGELFSGEK